MLNKVLETDEGARRLGEVALVPHSSPILGLGVLFYNTSLRRKRLLPHRARPVLFQVLPRRRQSLAGPDRRQGGNSSLIHIDWMIGSDKVDIDGVAADGSRVPVMRKGEWA